MAANISAFSTPRNSAISTDTRSFLEAARLINSDTKCHIRHSRFSSALSRRFYKNNSLRAHGSNLIKTRNLHEQKRALLEAIQAENESLTILEIKLWEESFHRREALERHRQNVLAYLTRCQCHVRRRQACRLAGKLRFENNSLCRIMMFCQTRTRGWRGRRLARLTQQNSELCRKRQEYASVRIQSYQRRQAPKRMLRLLRFQRQRLEHQAATKIQPLVRAAKCKKDKYCKIMLSRLQMQRSRAAVCLQCCTRKKQSRVLFRKLYLEECVRKAKEAKMFIFVEQQSIPPVALVSPKRPFLVGKPHRESIVGLIRNERHTLIEHKSKANNGTENNTHSVTQGDLSSELDSAYSFRHLTLDDASCTGRLSNPMRSNSTTYSDPNIVEIARQRALARSSLVAKKRRETKEIEQVSVRVAAERAIALELKRKQLLRANVTSKRKSVSPQSAVDDNKKKLEQRETQVLTSEMLQGTVPEDEKQLQTLSPTSSLANPLFDVSFEEFIDENENDLVVD